jgi:hypothetical protein
MDYETLSNCFVAVFQGVKSDDYEVFVVHDLQNDIDRLISFLEDNILLDEWHISFNGLGFDSQITEYILRTQDQLREMGGCEIAEWLYGKAQNIIQSQDENRFLEFSPNDLQINQIDVFKLNHWDNPAKRSSLKWIQYTMDWANIVDMPIHHATEITTFEQIEQIIYYCKNDVSSTKKIMELSKKQIELRKSLTEEYNINLFSASEPRISKELFLHFLSKKTGIKKFDLKNLRTKRDQIVVNDIILDYVSFKTATFQRLLAKFRDIVLDPKDTKNGFKYSIQYRGVKTDFGLGGLHGAWSKSRIFESNEEMIIMTSDVTSFYPNLAIRNKWSPAHIPKEEFCEQYEWFFEERKKISKKDIRNYVYKIILNSTYGLSNDENSFLYDPEFTMRITINGQLSLAMLYEMLTEGIPGAIPIMQNTDGLETMIPREYEQKYYDICKEWEQITQLQLEHDKYQRMIIGDVNNYIAVHMPKEVDIDTAMDMSMDNPHYIYRRTPDGVYSYQAVKCKGRFEFHDLALHKNKSFLVIPKTIFYYFVHGIDPKEFLSKQTNIFDFCGGKKIRGDWKFIEHLVEKTIDPNYLNYSLKQKRDYLLSNGWEQSWSDDNWVRSNSTNKEANTGISTEAAFNLIVPKIGGEYKECPLQHTIRYYISNNGSKIIKHNLVDERSTQLEAGKWLQTLFIDYVEKDINNYDLNYDYYLEKIMKEIHNLEPVKNQLSLF